MVSIADHLVAVSPYNQLAREPMGLLKTYTSMPLAPIQCSDLTGGWWCRGAHSRLAAKAMATSDSTVMISPIQNYWYKLPKKWSLIVLKRRIYNTTIS